MTDRTPKGAYAKATRERFAKGDIFSGNRWTPGGGEVTGQQVVPLIETLLRRRLITRTQYEAGQWFADTVEAIPVHLRSSMSPPTGGSREAAALRAGEIAIQAKREFKAAVQALGQEMTSILFWVAVEGKPAKGWAEKRGLSKPEHAGMTGLRFALNRLVEHLEIDTDVGNANGVRRSKRPSRKTNARSLHRTNDAAPRSLVPALGPKNTHPQRRGSFWEFGKVCGAGRALRKCSRVFNGLSLFLPVFVPFGLPDWLARAVSGWARNAAFQEGKAAVSNIQALCWRKP